MNEKLYVLPWGHKALNDIGSYKAFGGSSGKLLATIQCIVAKRLSSYNRIGPHNIDVLSVLIGNLLGDGHGEQRSGNPRFTQQVPNGHLEYLYWQHAFYSYRGYCSMIKPIIKPQPPQKNSKIYFSGKFNLYTFSSQKWVYDMFYTNEGVKVVPPNIADYQNNLTLAIWYMDDGRRYKNGAYFSTYCFTYDEHLILQQALLSNFGLNVRIDKRPAGYVQVVPESEYALFVNIVSPHIIGGMQYKIAKP